MVNVSYQLNDYDIDEAIKKRKRNYRLFLKIVGENPLDQIDWIIENGLDKFNYWFRCYETGKIYSPATVKEKQIIIRNRYVLEEYSLTQVLNGREQHVLSIDKENFDLKHLELTDDEIKNLKINLMVI
jgi:hypothetical protein